VLEQLSGQTPVFSKGTIRVTGYRIFYSFVICDLFIGLTERTENS